MHESEKSKSLSRVRLLETSWTAAHQAPPSVVFSRQEYCSGVPLPSQQLFSFILAAPLGMQDLSSPTRGRNCAPCSAILETTTGLPGKFFFLYCGYFSGYPVVPPCSFDLHSLRANKQDIFSCVCCCLVAKSCLTLCHPMDCSPPGSMEFSKQEYWNGLPFPSPGGSSQSRDQICISCIGRQFLYHWATWEAICKPLKRNVYSDPLPSF